MTRTEMLNALAARLGASRYLEIGVQTGRNFAKVDVAWKVGVDPDRRSKATVFWTSDAYFADLDRKETGETFDLVFVDGLHHADQVERDIRNALRYLTPGGAIVVHDCDPPTERSGQRKVCGGVWCGDVFRGWIRFRATTDRVTFTVDADLGCGVVLDRPASSPALPDVDPDSLSSLEWKDFHADRGRLLGLISPRGFEDIVSELPSLRSHD